MKRLSLLISILIMLGFPGLQAAQNEDIKGLFSLQVAKSGCCKVRKSPQHPWSKTGRSFAQCKEINKRDDDSIYNSSGKIWWDRSC